MHAHFKSCIQFWLPYLKEDIAELEEGLRWVVKIGTAPVCEPYNGTFDRTTLASH